MEVKILVLYIGVAGVRSEDVSSVTRKIAHAIIPDMFRGEVIVIPTQSTETKIECINPKYISEENLIKEHTELMKELNKALQEQLELIKENKI